MKTKHLLSLVVIGFAVTTASMTFASNNRGMMPGRQMRGLSGSRIDVCSGMRNHLGSGIRAGLSGSCDRMMENKGRGRNQSNSGANYFGSGNCPLMLSGERPPMGTGGYMTGAKVRPFGTGTKPSLSGLKLGAKSTDSSDIESEKTFFRKFFDTLNRR